MSDPVDDDPLFSQDDIDKLLNAQSIDEAEESNFNNGNDEIGELSQDDIDNLLNAASAPEEPELQPASNQNDESAIDEDIDIGELSQDDIDRLLNSSSASEELTILSSGDQDGDSSETDTEDDDLGDLSQDDIDKMLNSPVADSDQEADLSSIKDEFEEDEDAFDLISQDDIDKLMATDLSDEQFSESDSMPDPDINLDDLAVDMVSPEEERIDPSEALDIQDCLITQDTIDNLLDSGNQNADIEDDELFQEETESETDDPFLVDLSADEPDSGFALGDDDDISGSDIDSLLSESPEDMDDLLGDISQDDINGFLSESEDQPDDISTSRPEDEDNVRNIISQDDIDALLAGTDEEDEDILADMEMDEDLKSFTSPVPNVESPLPEDDEAQVILEEIEEPSTTLADGTVRQLEDLMDEKQEKPVKRRFLVKLILGLSLVLMLIVGCVAGAYFMFFKDKVDQLVPLSKPVADTQENDGVKPEDPGVVIQESQSITPGTITLENFIIFTPDREDGIIYVSVDISISYSYSKVFDTINNKLPYYRGVIYDAIDNALKSDKGDKLTESDLLEIVRNAFNQALSGGKVDKIVFVNFKTG